MKAAETVDKTQEKKSKIIKEFSRFAKEYAKYNVIQSEVAKQLVGYLQEKRYPVIIDIGCGSGEIYKNMQKNDIVFDHYIALDLSQEMLQMHPTDASVKKICGDFNSVEAYLSFDTQKEALLISSSALQWSLDLDFTFSWLSKKTKKAYFAIFTSSTFKTLHQIAKIDSPIYTEEQLKQSIEKYYNATYHTHAYKLHFESTYEMLNYIKKSGVSGGEKKLTYVQVKKLIKEYPFDYLEFEVLFAEATSHYFA
ncbi:MAG: methyltransferase [Sulfurovum sp.]|nr:methyltransferase [Sulfurovum sp.]MDD3602704.1 methyltransferase [Sulfurovum sp.]